MMLLRTIRRLAGALAGLLVLAVAAAAVAAPAGPPIRIGSTLALTGPLAPTALLHKIAAEIAIEELNRGSGLLGRPVEWTVLDDQSKPDVARSLYEKLITVDKVDLVMGPYATSGILAAMGVAQRYQKMLIHNSFGMPYLAKYEMHIPALPFGPEPNRTIPATVFNALAATASPPKTVAVVTSKFPSAQYISSGARDVAAQRGLKVALYLEYEFGTRDFGAIAARVKDASPDFLWVGALGLDGNQLLEAMRKLDYMPPRHFHLFPAPGPLATAPDGKLALSTAHFEEHPPFTNNPVAARFVASFHERAAKAGLPYVKVDTQSATEYASWQVLEAAVTATKSIDDKALAQWLRKNHVDTIVGRMRFDGTNNYGDDLTKVKQVQDGRWIVVWPKEYAPAGMRLLPALMPSATLLGQSVVSGLLTGGLYGLLALGLSLSWGLLRLVNLAHFALAFLGAYLTYQLGTVLRLDPWVSVLVIVPVFFGLGVGLHAVFVRFAVAEFTSLLVTFGLTVILESVIQWFWTADFRRYETPYASASTRVGPLFVPTLELLAGLTAAALAVATWGWLRFTYVGKALRASAEDPAMAAAFGVNHRAQAFLVSGVSAAYAGVAGTYIALMSTLAPAQIWTWIGVVFAVVIIGGLANPIGALLAGLLIGVSESVTMAVVTPAWAPLVSFSVLILLLVARPDRA